MEDPIMDFDEWEPVYEVILNDFGYERAADRAARDLLAALVGDHPSPDPTAIGLTGAEVAIAGAAPSLRAELDRVRAADVVLAASTAADILASTNIDIDCVITDLDGRPLATRSLARTGVPVLVHAHGDNRPALRRHAPRFPADGIVPTTQARPIPRVRNFGGFTDGDRAAFFADHFGADRLSFPGWEFDDPTLSGDKAAKLRWAERLLHWLERRRGERFDVLAGRRSDIDTSQIPHLE